jgi:AcrR family transcriptional regulator
MTVSDPLIDTLFRATTPARDAAAPTIASAAPVRVRGTRTRAGNAMTRTRAALLDGARRAVEVNGTKITMAQVAAAAGVAKATLYNHFRTRDAVLAALLVGEVTRLVERATEQPLSDALAGTANTLSTHPALRALARLEPATVAVLGCIDTTAPGWQLARAGVDAALAAERRGGADLVLRWLASFVVSPAAPATIAAEVSILVAALPPVGVGVNAAPSAVAQRVG